MALPLRAARALPAWDRCPRDPGFPLPSTLISTWPCPKRSVTNLAFISGNVHDASNAYRSASWRGDFAAISLKHALCQLIVHPDPF